LLLFAKEQFELDKPRKDGSTARQHLVKVWEMTGTLPAELANLPPMPELATAVWGTFSELSRFRGNNGFGPNRISPSLMLDWCRLTGTKLNSWEIATIAALDDAFLTIRLAE
jgi:hypothetical protein